VQIRVSARHTAISEHDRGVIAEKIDRLAKFLPGMERAEVHFSEEKNPRIAEKEVCEVTLEGHGHHVRCKSHGPDVMTSVDRAVDKLENKLYRLKTKLGRKPKHKTNGAKWPAGEQPLPSELEPVLETETVTVVLDEMVDGYRIVKSKTVEKLTLSPYDAAERMELVGHSFYFFTNSSTGRAAVVYRRDDGDIGLIDETG
jgi:putative sigma-54 modulation protein